MQHKPTYGPGDKIRLELEVSDESGVDKVEIWFHSQDNVTHEFQIIGDAQGAKITTLALEKEVTGDIAPGDYQSRFVVLYDLVGNRTITYPDPAILLRIEGVPGDHEGPQLNSWRWR